MGREVKRVPLNFEWPMNETWTGYLMPKHLHAVDCKICNGGGLNSKTKIIEDQWYDFDETGNRWCDKLTQVEVDALIKNGRLSDFTSKGITPTPDQVNEWSKTMFGHDAINRWICVEARARSLGVYGLCEECEGEGYNYRDDQHKADAESWEPYEVPTGDGWQMWETTSEGSPISPVFETPEELARWLTDNNASTFGSQTTTYDNWLSMVNSGWAMSGVMVNGEMKSGVEAISNERN
jgi:hypothetical protein